MFDPHQLMEQRDTWDKLIGYNIPYAIKPNGLKKLLPWNGLVVADNIFDPLIGVEIEAENLQKDFEASDNAYPELAGVWFNKEDGSLRHNGREFCSNPLPLGAYPQAFKLLSQAIPEAKFSHRCSVHVHIDCRLLNRAQLLTLCILYTVFEPLFFAIAGRQRRANNFCVGLEYTDDFNTIVDVVSRHTSSKSLRKYSAFNILPMVVNEDVPLYGTVEFRHLYGTLDINILMEWLSIIHRLRLAAVEIPLTTLLEKTRRLNIDSSYLNLIDRVFREHGEVFWKYTSLEKLTSLLERHVSLVKQSTLHNEFSHRLLTLESIQPDSQFAKIAKRLYPNNFKTAKSKGYAAEQQLINQILMESIPTQGGPEPIMFNEQMLFATSNPPIMGNEWNPPEVGEE